MSYRVTTEEVLTIIDTSLTDVDAFIAAANVTITGMCGSDYDDDVLKELERWLAAHLVSIRDPSKSAFTEQDADGVSQKYQLTASSPVGLATTRYGQQVLILDYLGKLANLGLPAAVVKFASVGASNDEFTQD